MLSKLAKTISGTFLGETVAETEEIYRTADSKFSIQLGLFQKHENDILWLKFVHKSFMTDTSSAIGIDVDSFQHFADFLGLATSNDERDAGLPGRLSLFTRFILAITEGISQSVLLGEYRSQRVPNVAIRFFSFKNRRAERRVVFDHKTSGHDTYEVMDSEVLSVIRREIERRRRRTRCPS